MDRLVRGSNLERHLARSSERPGGLPKIAKRGRRANTSVCGEAFGSLSSATPMSLQERDLKRAVCAVPKSGKLTAESAARVSVGTPSTALCRYRTVAMSIGSLCAASGYPTPTSTIYIVCQTPMEAQSCPSFTLPAFALPVQRVNRSGCRYRMIQVKKVRKETLFRRCLDCISLLKIIKFYSSFSSSFSKSTDRKRRHADLFCLANHRWQTRLCLRATAHRAAIQQPQRATGKALDPRD